MQNPVRFVEGCTHNEDVIFSAKMFFCAQKLLYKDNFLYIYRKNFQSSTNTVEYTLDNAFEIPEAWFEAKGFVNKCKDINDKCKRNWKKFCETTSSIRCLEMISILAEQGIEYESMYNIMRHKEYFVNIDNLKSSELAEWQITDLLTYKRDKVYFYNSKKQNSINKRLKSLSRWKCIRYLIEKRKYKLVIKDIL